MSTETITPDTYITTIPERYQNVYTKAVNGSRTAAVKAFCQHCMGYSEGTTRAIRECPTTWCPLWSVRPYQDKGRGMDTETNDDNGDGDEVENEDGGVEVEGGQQVSVSKPKRVPSQAFLESRRGRVRDPERDGRVRELADEILKVLPAPESFSWMGKWDVLNSLRIPLYQTKDKRVIPLDAEWAEALNLLISEGRIEVMGVKRGRRYRRVT